MDINKTLKINKIKKIDFALACGLKSRTALNYQIEHTPDKVKGALCLYLLKKSGVNIYKLLGDRIV